MLRKSWMWLVIVGLVGVLAGVMIAGRPTSADKRQFNVPTTTSSTAPAPVVTASSAPAVSAVPSTSTTLTMLPTTSTVAPTPTSSSPTSPAPTTRPRSDVRVLVANGANRARLATAVSGELLGSGWSNAKPVDALRTSPASKVYFRDGFEDSAAELVADLGHDLPLEAFPTSRVTDVDSDADLLVLLGTNYPG